jgi:hypothetical protein
MDLYLLFLSLDVREKGKKSMEINADFFGGSVKKYYPNIGEVVSFVPRYRTSGAGFRNEHFPRRHLGYGWGSTILSFFKPFLKKGLHAVVNVASKVASDAIEGQNVKQSLKEHGMKGISNLLQKQPGDENPAVVAAAAPPATVKKRVNPAAARRKTKQVVTKKSVSGSGAKKKKKKSLKKSSLKNKYPILEYM